MCQRPRGSKFSSCGPQTWGWLQIRVGISLSADKGHIGKTDISVSVVPLPSIYWPILSVLQTLDHRVTNKPNWRCCPHGHVTTWRRMNHMTCTMYYMFTLLGMAPYNLLIIPWAECSPTFQCSIRILIKATPRIKLLVCRMEYITAIKLSFPTLSRRIDQLKTEFHFKFAALALQFNWKMQLIMPRERLNQHGFPFWVISLQFLLTQHGKPRTIKTAFLRFSLSLSFRFQWW